jgi:hypothetical protein
MVVRYGNISASCPSCGAHHFELLTLAPTEVESVLACLRCRATTIHGHLVSQIGDEAVRQATTAMSAMKERHRQYRHRIDNLRRQGLPAPIA